MGGPQKRIRDGGRREEEHLMASAQARPDFRSSRCYCHRRNHRSTPLAPRIQLGSKHTCPDEEDRNLIFLSRCPDHPVTGTELCPRAYPASKQAHLALATSSLIFFFLPFVTPSLLSPSSPYRRWLFNLSRLYDSKAFVADVDNADPRNSREIFLPVRLRVSKPGSPIAHGCLIFSGMSLLSWASRFSFLITIKSSRRCPRRAGPLLDSRSRSAVTVRNSATS